ncbi:uncharacterized protein LOC142804024 isoform X1 [Rhipicephalus microplus]|uniref:uncharacterized protein LOC142804024 isoform X1 n=1 Tax=Rhipicephalus microplus TaxID=6941 RepID=UPI003F6CF27C
MFAESTSTASANQRSSGPPCVPRNEKSNSCSAQRNSAPGTSASSAAHYPRKTAVSLTGSSSWPSRMDKYLIKQPRLSAEFPGNPSSLCNAADDYPTHHGRTSAPSMDTLGAISAATADTPKSASLLPTNEEKVLESASKNWGATTGKPSTHGRLEQIQPGPTNSNCA